MSKTNRPHTCNGIHPTTVEDCFGCAFEEGMLATRNERETYEIGGRVVTINAAGQEAKLHPVQVVARYSDSEQGYRAAFILRLQWRVRRVRYALQR